MSQKELARRLTEYGFGIQQSAIAKIENGTRPLRISEMIAIAQALGIPYQSLLLAHENYANFSEDPVTRLQEIVDSETLMANHELEEEIKHIQEFLDQYTRRVGSIRAAEQMLGRLKITEPEELAKVVGEILKGIDDDTEPSTGD